MGFLWFLVEAKKNIDEKQVKEKPRKQTQKLCLHSTTPPSLLLLRCAATFFSDRARNFSEKNIFYNNPARLYPPPQLPSTPPLFPHTCSQLSSAFRIAWGYLQHRAGLLCCVGNWKSLLLKQRAPNKHAFVSLSNAGRELALGACRPLPIHSGRRKRPSLGHPPPPEHSDFTQLPSTCPHRGMQLCVGYGTPRRGCPPHNQPTPFTLFFFVAFVCIDYPPIHPLRPRLTPPPPSSPPFRPLLDPAIRGRGVCDTPTDPTRCVSSPRPPPHTFLPPPTYTGQIAHSQFLSPPPPPHLHPALSQSRASKPIEQTEVNNRRTCRFSIQLFLAVQTAEWCTRHCSPP